MDIDALASLESQKKCCNELVDLVVKKESFIILAGVRGSGRTVMCEQVVNETDSKMRAVFIPCHKDMPLQRLRELFLQQLLPNTEFNTDLNLPDALLKTYIPHKDKILVVVDDVDTVVSSFFNELLALYEQVLGQSRFSFILVGQPLWAEEKISRAASTSKVVITLKEIPALNIQESLVLSRHIFAVNNAMVIYKALSKRLPELLAEANGNLSRVIAMTEKFMKEPTAPQSSQDIGRKNKLQTKTKSKSSSVGIFVTVVCIIIVLACLIPIFFGGNFFSPDDKAPTKAQVVNENSLLLNDGSLSFDDSLSTDDGLLLPNANKGIDAKSTTRQTEHSVTLSGKDLEKIEGGANGSGYPRGVDGSVANKGNQNEQFVTLHREDNINHRNAQEPEQEMTSLDVSATQQQILQTQQQVTQQQVAQQQVDAQAAAAVAQSANAIKAAEDAKLDEALAAENAKAAKAAEERQKQQQQAAAKARELEKAAQDKLAADRARVEAARQQEPQQTASNTRPSLRAGQVISLADEQRSQRVTQNPLPPPRVANNTPARGNGRAIEGNINEVLSIPNSHFTVQIVSSSSRSNVTNAAKGLNGRYWVLETRYNNRPWYVLISGDYPTREAAAAAARQIPSSVSQGATPFAKRIMDIKPEIR